MSAEFTADFFDGRTSCRHAVVVGVREDTLAIRGDDMSLDVPCAQADVHPRLGTAPVRITLPGGGLLVVPDFEAVDSSLGVPRARTLAYRLESHIGFVLVALAGVVVGAWFAYHDGIPWTSRKIAQRISPEVETELSKEALASLDALFLRRSLLSPEQRAAASREFSNLLLRADVPQGTRLEFRDGRGLGANAFTLPGGVIVVTDKLVALLDDRQLAAVFAHELGHVHYRHGTRHLLNNSIHALFAMAVFGDASAVASVAATVPTALINAGYSRDFEREADSYGIELLKRSGRSPRDFASALAALRDDALGPGGDGKPRIPKNKFGYLATHPDIEERIKAAEEAAR